MAALMNTTAHVSCSSENIAVCKEGETLAFLQKVQNAKKRKLTSGRKNEKKFRIDWTNTYLECLTKKTRANNKCVIKFTSRKCSGL